jgi:hypothetical protein
VIFAMRVPAGPGSLSDVQDPPVRKISQYAVFRRRLKPYADAEQSIWKGIKMSIRRVALSAIAAAAVLGFGASPALAQIPLQPAAPAPVTSPPGPPSAQPIYIPSSTGSVDTLSAAMGGGPCNPEAGPLHGCG